MPLVSRRQLNIYSSDSKLTPISPIDWEAYVEIRLENVLNCVEIKVGVYMPKDILAGYSIDQ